MIICCGECLIDMIPTPTGEGETAFTPKSGGAVFNTAIGLGRLGTQVGFISGISSDLFGKQLRSSLEASHVDTGLAIESDRPTTLAFVQLTNGHASYTFYDENTAGRSLDPKKLPDIPNDVSAMYFGGISLISEPCADFYAALAVRESKDRVIALDPNIRPSFIRDADKYRSRLKKMIKHSDIVKVSDEDLGWIIPDQAPLMDKVQMLNAMGPKIVILTKGGEGSSAMIMGKRIVDAPAQLVEVVDTVGAGDTFNSGVLAKLSENGLLTKQALTTITDRQMIEALSHGAKVAAVTVSRSGANPPWAEELVGNQA